MRGFLHTILGAIISVAFVLLATIIVFFLEKDLLPFVKAVPSDLVYVSMIGVLIYIGVIAAGKVQTAEYKLLAYIPEFMLRFVEAPVFMAAAYALILQNNSASNQPGTLIALSLFIGLFTRNFEEFLKLIRSSILKPIENAVSKKISSRIGVSKFSESMPIAF